MQGEGPYDHEGGVSEEQEGFDLRAILAMLRRRRAIILLVALPLLIPASLVPFVMPKRFEAVATIEFEKRAPVLDLGRDVEANEVSGRSGEALEASVVTLVTSDAVLGRVLDAMPPGGEGSRSMQFLVARLANKIMGETTPTPAQQRQMRLDVLRNALRVQLEGAGDYAQIIAKARTPEQAAALANAVAESYVREMSEKREAAARRAVTWLNEQIYELRTQTSQKEQASSELISQGLNPRMFEASNDGKEASSLSTLEDQIRDTRIDLVAATQRLAEITPGGSDQKGGSEEAAERLVLQKQLQEEATKLEAARLKYTPTHPEVRRLEETVAALSARVGPPEPGRGDMTADMSEYQSLKRDKGRLQARLDVLEKSRDEQLAQGGKSEAYLRYRRIQSELAVDREMLGLLLTRRNETMVASAKQDTGARVLDAAVAPLYPAGPGQGKVLALAWFGAIAAGFGLAGILELLDRRMRDPERISRLLGMPSLCTLPVLPVDKAVPERQGGLPPGSIGSERYRSLRTALVFAMRMRKVHTLLVTSGIPGEGKTTTSANLAAAFAKQGRKVVLVDADMRRPRLHRVFGIARSPGLSEVLSNKARLAEALLRPTNEEFELLPAGAMPDNPTDLLASGAWSELINELKQDYELVVIDSPVVLAVSDSLLLAADADALLLVHKPGSLERRGLVQLRDDLRRAGAHPLGVVFNQVDRHDRDLYPTYLESPYLQTSDGKRPRRKAG